mgnify:FL=1
MVAMKKHLTDSGRVNITQIKSGMNNGRTEFSWEHLKDFYNQPLLKGVVLIPFPGKLRLLEELNYY